MRALAIVLLFAPALAGAVTQGTYDKLVKAELGKMSGRQAGKTSDNFEQFMTNREAVTNKHMGLFKVLAKRILDKAPAQLRTATVKQADQAFGKLAKGRLGTDVPDDFCFMRAEIIARALEAQGFAVQKVNAIATGGKQLEVKTHDTVDGEVKWGYHVAAFMPVGKAKTELVMDPSLGDKPMTLRGWKAKMHDAGMQTLVTSADQLSYSSKPAATREERVDQLAYALAQLGGVREYDRFRKQALDKK